jgi:hypothetical protein
VSGVKPAHGLRRAGENGPWVAGGTAACHTRPVGRPTGPRPGGPAQPRRRPATRAARARIGAVMRSTAVRWGLAGGKVLPASTGGVPGWHRAGEVEAGLTLAMPRRAGAVRWRRGGGRHRGREGSGERRGQRGVGRQRWCRAIAAGGGTRVTDKRGRVSTGPSGSDRVSGSVWR